MKVEDVLFYSWHNTLSLIYFDSWWQMTDDRWMMNYEWWPTVMLILMLILMMMLMILQMIRWADADAVIASSNTRIYTRRTLTVIFVYSALVQVTFGNCANWLHKYRGYVCSQSGKIYTERSLAASSSSACFRKGGWWLFFSFSFLERGMVAASSSSRKGDGGSCHQRAD